MSCVYAGALQSVLESLTFAGPRDMSEATFQCTHTVWKGPPTSVSITWMSFQHLLIQIMSLWNFSSPLAVRSMQEPGLLRDQIPGVCVPSYLSPASNASLLQIILIITQPPTGVPRGGLGCSTPPPKFRRPYKKPCQTQPDCENC